MADGGEEVEGGARGSGTPSTKEAVKSLTAQFITTESRDTHDILWDLSLDARAPSRGTRVAAVALSRFKSLGKNCTPKIIF
ncbi:hypothetical protein WN944_006845 [Citrus x changshan-huyou]|uniref:Uncharacterized protein n=1 Tax=Citrus x changshan-huyou TaxID=2935761 RepID=A0AAP0QTV2_9ROSI